MYDELDRVPLVISWPEKIRAARTDALATLIDVVPTLCDLTGMRTPEGVDGRSLRPLEGRAARVHDMVFGECDGKQSWRVPIRMVRTPRWKYVRYGEQARSCTTSMPIPASCATSPACCNDCEAGFLATLS